MMTVPDAPRTSGAPSETGVSAYPVGPSGVQSLTVSADHPLALFNLTVSLEWDAHTDPTYLDQLTFNLQRASEYLYNFTDGQAALGRVTVYQNGDEWAYSHIVIETNNRLRPFANQGGLVDAPTVDPQHQSLTDTITYSPGQVTIGATWNRYGNPGQTLSDDWSLILAHELSHYLFYEDDTYLGLDTSGRLIPVNTCEGSAMGDLYDRPQNTEFIFNTAFWNTYCAATLAARFGETVSVSTRILYGGSLTTASAPGLTESRTLALSGSRPAEGSSKKRISGSSAIALASPALFLMPPLISEG